MQARMKKRLTEDSAVVTVTFADGTKGRRKVEGPLVRNIWDMAAAAGGGNNDMIPWREVAKKELIHGEAAVVVRASRERAEMTQAGLAKQLGVSQGYVSDIEHGKRPIGKDMAKRLGKLFSINYRMFL